jgi:hypothetical protein
MAHTAEVGELLTSVREHFAGINRDPDLNDDDKQRLKEFYLEELIARRKVWVDPNGHALAFLRKDKAEQAK